MNPVHATVIRLLPVFFLFHTSALVNPVIAAEAYYGASISKVNANSLLTSSVVVDTLTGEIFTPVTTEDKSGMGWSIYGGYMATDYFGIEVGYTDLGKYSRIDEFTVPIIVNSETTVSTSTFNAVALVNLPVSELFDVFGKAGVFNWNSDLKTTGSQSGVEYTGEPFDESDIEMTFGIGAKYRMLDNMSIRLDWDRYKIGDGDINKFGAAVEYNFEM